MTDEYNSLGWKGKYRLSGWDILQELKEKGTAMGQIKRMGKFMEYNLNLWKETFDIKVKHA